MHLLNNTLLKISIDISYVFGDVAVRAFEVDSELGGSDYSLLNVIFISIKSLFLMLFVYCLTIVDGVSVHILIYFIKVGLYFIFSRSCATS